MSLFSRKVIIFYIIVGTLSALASFGVISYWYESIMSHHIERLSEIVHIHKSNIETIHQQQVKRHNKDMKEALDASLRLLKNSFIDTRQYGFTNDFFIVTKKNGKYDYLYRNINGVPNTAIEPFGKLGEGDPVAIAYDGESGSTTYIASDGRIYLAAYNFINLEHSRVAVVARVPYKEIAGLKVAAIASVAILSLLVFIGGSLAFYYLSRVNLRELNKAHKDLEIFGDIMNSAREHISYIGLDRRFVVVNNMYAETFRIPKSKLKGMHLKDFHGDIRYREEIDSRLTKCFKGDMVKFQLWIDERESGKICLDVKYVPHFEAGEVVGIVVTASNITELEKAKQQLLDRTQQLQALALDLEDKVKQETNKRIQHEQLFFEQKKFADMGQMINAIAHQWRQPLNSLGLYIQYVIDSVKDESVTEEILAEFKADTMALIQHMSKTIDDFRGFFNPNTSQTDFEVIKAVIETVSLVDAQLKNHYIEYSVSCKCKHKEFLSCNKLDNPPCAHPMSLVAGYPSEFKQVLMNIVQNAKDALSERASDRKMEIQVEAQDDKVIVRVCDNGGGIEPALMNKIFDPYFTTKSEGKGTGIGLYMSKLIVEDHMGGTLHVANDQDGAVFVIVLRKLEPESVCS